MYMVNFHPKLITFVKFFNRKVNRVFFLVLIKLEVMQKNFFLRNGFVKNVYIGGLVLHFSQQVVKCMFADLDFPY